MLLLFLVLFTPQSVSFPLQPDITLEVHQKAGYGGRIIMLAPHGDETVVNAYAAQLAENGLAKFLILKQRGTRHLFLTVDEVEVQVDPNRIFTPLGARQTVEKQNPGLAPERIEKATQKALALAGFIEAQLGGLRPGTVLIALHNNTDGYDDDGNGGIGTVSIRRYRSKYLAGAGFILDVYQGKGDEDDLFFVTKPNDFKAMKAAGWHVLLQHPRVKSDPDEDDGSLSVYAEMKGLRYINVEAQRKLGDDHLEVQKRMLDFVLDLVGKVK